MIKVYAVSLVLGIIGVVVAIFAGALAESLGRPEKDPGQRFGLTGKASIGALTGFGIGGMSAEFSPLDFRWEVSLLLAIIAAILAVSWVRYAVRQAEG